MADLPKAQDLGPFLDTMFIEISKWIVDNLAMYGVPLAPPVGLGIARRMASMAITLGAKFKCDERELTRTLIAFALIRGRKGLDDKLKKEMPFTRNEVVAMIDEFYDKNADDTIKKLMS